MGFLCNTFLFLALKKELLEELEEDEKETLLQLLQLLLVLEQRLPREPLLHLRLLPFLLLALVPPPSFVEHDAAEVVGVVMEAKLPRMPHLCSRC